MYTLDEYILMSRASKVFRHMYKTSHRIRGLDNTSYIEINSMSDYFGGRSQDDLLEIQNKFISLIQYAIPGSTVSRFLSVKQNGEVTTPFDQLPMFLIEIADPKLFIPCVLVESGVLVISPFENALLKEYSECKYAIELIDIETLNNVDPKVPSSFEVVLNGVSKMRGHMVHTQLKDILITIAGKPIADRSDIVHNMFKDKSAYDVDIVAEESVIMNKIKSRYAIESVDDELDQEDLSVTDFMPLYVHSEDEGNFVYIDQVINKANGKRQTYIRLKNAEKQEVPKDEYNNAYTKNSSVVIKDGDLEPRFMLKLSENLFYVGNNKIALVEDNKIIETFTVSDNYSIFEGSSYGTEATLSEIVVEAKKIGIRISSGLMQVLAPLIKWPKELVIEILRDVKKLLFVFDKEIEKEDAKVYQEKALNDSLDVFADRVSHYARVLTFSATSGAIFLTPVIGIFSFFFWRVDDADARVRAINRVIKNFRDKINRIEAAIEISKQESRYEEVIDLMKEKQLHESAIRELVQLKRSNYKKADDAYKEKYPELAINERINDSGSAY